MQPLRVGHVNLAWGFRGGERQTELLIKCLSDLGCEQYLICRKDNPLADHLRGLKNLTIFPLRKIIDLRLNGHRFLKGRCDIVHAHEAKAAQWSYLHHILCKTPFILTRRVPEAVHANSFNQGVYKKASAVIAISTAIAESLNDQFHRDIQVISSSCAHFESDPMKVQELRERYKGCFVIGHAGALVDRHKGQSVLIRAASAIKNQIPNLKLVFLGSGSDENAFKDLVQSLGLSSNTDFEGFVDNVCDYLKIMDLFVYPSNYEGLGSVLLDVMEQGVPIIATAVDGIPDLIEDHKNGLLIKKQDHEGLSEAILTLYKDQSLRETLIKNGLEEAQRKSPEAMAGAYFKLYQRILNQGSEAES